MHHKRVSNGSMLLGNVGEPIKLNSSTLVCGTNAYVAYDHLVRSHALLPMSIVEGLYYRSTSLEKEDYTRLAGVEPDDKGRIWIPEYSSTVSGLKYKRVQVPEHATGVICQVGPEEKAYLFINQVRSHGIPYDFLVVPAIAPVNLRGGPKVYLKQDTVSHVVDQTRSLGIQPSYTAIQIAVGQWFDRKASTPLWCYGVCTSTYRRGDKHYYTITGQRIMDKADPSSAERMLATLLNKDNRIVPTWAAIEATLSLHHRIGSDMEATIEEKAHKIAEEILERRAKGARGNKRVIRRRDV